MPYKTCTKCKQSLSLDSFRTRKYKTGIPYLYSQCTSCEHKLTKEHQTNNREYWQSLNKKSYLNWSSEFRQKRNKQSLLRHTRIKNANRNDEFTEFVSQEAYDLCRLREKYTPFKWHIDHILPLNGPTISGLHVWNNLQVIPASLNLSKGNKEMIKFLS